MNQSHCTDGCNATPRQKELMGKSKEHLQGIVDSADATDEVTLVLVLHLF